MPFRECQPSGDLARFMAAVWSSAVGPGDGGESRIVPDGCVELVVVLAGRFGIGGQSFGPGVAVVGLATRPLATHLAGGTRLVGVRLTPAGALRLVGGALAGLVNGAVDGAEVLGPHASRLRVPAAEFARTGDSTRLAVVMRSALSGRHSHDPRVEEAAVLIHTSAGRLTVAAVAGQVGLSTRQLVRSFEKHLGVRPKLLGRIARFRTAFDQGLAGGPGGWAGVAARCGYADQAHLTREFREFTGQPPEQMRSEFATAGGV